MAEQTSLPLEDPTFPPSLSEVSAAVRAQQTFGWSPGLVGVALVLAAFLSTSVKRNAGGLGLVAGMALIGLALAAYEVYRRRAPAVLVRREGRVGLYRGGALASAFSVSQVTRYYLRLGNTIQFAMMPVMLTVLGVVLAVGPKDKPGEPMALLLAAGAGALVASMVRTRLVCHHYYIPRGKKTQLVILTGADSKRLFPPSPQAAH